MPSFDTITYPLFPRTLTAEQSTHKHTDVKCETPAIFHWVRATLYRTCKHVCLHGDDSQDLVGMETPVAPGNRYSVFHIVVEGDVNKSIGPTFSEILAFSVFIDMFVSLLRSVIAAICYWSLQSWGGVTSNHKQPPATGGYRGVPDRSLGLCNCVLNPLTSEYKQRISAVFTQVCIKVHTEQLFSVFFSMRSLSCVTSTVKQQKLTWQSLETGEELSPELPQAFKFRSAGGR